MRRVTTRQAAPLPKRMLPKPPTLTRLRHAPPGHALTYRLERREALHIRSVLADRCPLRADVRDRAVARLEVLCKYLHRAAAADERADERADGKKKPRP